MGMTLVVAGTGTVALVACGGPDAKFGKIQAGELPQGESWLGVYYNPVYGHLHLVEQEGNVVGKWKRTDSSHWGELSGSADGNVLHYTWKEHQYGALGPAADTHGIGVFVFKAVEKGPPELDGQYSLDDSDSVGQWHCVKQLNMKPDLNSITGENPTDSAGQDRWH